MDGPPVDKPQSGRSHAPIKSRRGSSGGGERHNACWSDQPIDSDPKSQLATSPRPNPVGRTPPPGNPDDDTDARPYRHLSYYFGLVNRRQAALA
jgi:hypothetical protein